MSKCIYLCFVLFVASFVRDAQCEPEKCEKCVPVEKCTMYGDMTKRDQDRWRENHPCKTPEDKDLGVLFGFAPAAKGDYVCCPYSNIWGVEDSGKNNREVKVNSDSRPKQNTFKSELGSQEHGYDQDNLHEGQNSNIHKDDSDEEVSLEGSRIRNHSGWRGSFNGIPRNNNFNNFNQDPRSPPRNQNFNKPNERITGGFNTNINPILNSPRNNFNRPNPIYTPSNPSFNGGNPNFSGSNPNFIGGNPNFSGGNPNFNGGNPNFKSGTPSFNGGNPSFNGANPGFSGNNPSFNAVNPGFNAGNPGFSTGNPGFNTGNPSFNGANPSFNRPNPSFNGDNGVANTPNQRQPNSGQCSMSILPPTRQSGCCGVDLTTELMNSGGGRNDFMNRPSRRFKRDNPEDYGISLDNRIAGGKETRLDQYPWTALLKTTFDYGNKQSTFNCGGSLISSRYVLTAAHCVFEQNARVKSIEIYLAEFDKRTFPRDCINTPEGRKCIDNILVQAEDFVTHPNYDDTRLQNDIAVIRLRENVPYTEFTRPICLPPINIDNPDYSDLRLAVAGWGRNGSVPSNVKQSTVVNLVPQRQCSSSYPHLTNKHLCAAGRSGEDTCKGDSGGPLMMLYEGHYYVSGVVSGKRADAPCGTAVPSLYTNVYHYVNWIMNSIRQ